MALHTERHGTGGLPLVCLHGWGLNLRVFDPLARALAPHREVVQVDLPGHGRSDWQAQDTGFAAQCERLAAVLPDRCALLGWSLGGQFALRLAREQPRRVQRLVLLASTPRFVSEASWPHGVAPAVMQRFSSQLQSDWHGTVEDFLQLQLRGSRDAGAALEALHAALAGHGEAMPAALRAGLGFLRDNDLRGDCAATLQPALVVGGQHDRITPVGASRWLAANLRAAPAVELERAGHVPQLTHLDVLVPLLAEFLADD